MQSNHYKKYSCIGRAIREERKQKGFTQSDLAKSIGVSKSYLSKIEAPNCNKKFSMDLIFNISDELNIPVTQLMIYIPLAE